MELGKQKNFILQGICIGIQTEDKIYQVHTFDLWDSPRIGEEEERADGKSGVYSVCVYVASACIVLSCITFEMDNTAFERERC